MRSGGAALWPTGACTALTVVAAGAATPACALILGAEELPTAEHAGSGGKGGGDSTGTGSSCECPATQAWTRAFGATGNVTVAGAAADAQGNVVIAGSVSGDLDVAGSVLPGSGGSDLDVLVMKLSPCGDVVWADRFGDTADQQAFAVTIDPTAGEDSVLLTGTYAGSLDFAGTSGLLTATNPRAFIARLDRDTGKGIKSADAGPDATKGHRGTGVAAESDGSIYWVGAESDDTFLFARRLDATLNVVNAALPACALCTPHVAPGQGGDALLAGGFTGKFDIAAGNTGALSAAGDVDVFLLSVAPAPSPSMELVDPYGERFGDSLAQLASGIATDGAGSAFVAGSFAGELNMGSGSKTKTSAGGLDAFAARFDAALSTQWLSAFGDAGEQQANAIAFGGGALAVVGDFAGAIVFNADAGAHGPLKSAGGTDAFLVALDPATGVPTFAEAFGGKGADSGGGVAVDTNRNAFIAGVVEGPVDFGCATLGGTGKSIFVAKRALP
jgi:hypothetical protein